MIKKLDIVDFHAHVLPRADHGSNSVETSLWQIKSAIFHGVTRIIATPHFYPHRHTVQSFIKRRDEAYGLLMEHIPDGVEIKLGAEALICPGFEHLPDIEKLFVEGTRTILIELPYSDFQACYCDSVKEMVSSGIDVVIAHADRYPAENIEKMIKAGAKLQLNAHSTLGIIKRSEVYSWLDRKLVVALGSDIHERDGAAYRDFAKAIKRIGKSVEQIKEQSDLIWNQAVIKK